MSYAEHPSTNPYTAPVSDLGQRAMFHGYGGFWVRVVAAFIDGLILTVVSGAFGAAVGAAVAASGNEIGTGVTAFIQIVSFLIGLGYNAGLESSEKQATLGKMAMGLKVVDLRSHRISFPRALGRFFGKYLSAIILGIGFLMVAFTQKKQGLHDMLAGTLVVKVR
jgi:uncharacterized RDD family membrane protein YckC